MTFLQALHIHNLLHIPSFQSDFPSFLYKTLNYSYNFNNTKCILKPELTQEYILEKQIIRNINFHNVKN